MIKTNSYTQILIAAIAFCVQAIIAPWLWYYAESVFADVEMGETFQFYFFVGPFLLIAIIVSLTAFAIICLIAKRISASQISDARYLYIILNMIYIIAFWWSIGFPVALGVSFIAAGLLSSLIFSLIRKAPRILHICFFASFIVFLFAGPYTVYLKESRSPLCISGSCDEGSGEIVYFDDLSKGIYKGDLRNGKPDGNGTFSSDPSFAIWYKRFRWKFNYVGEWVAGKRNGKGKLSFGPLNEVIHDGQWEDGQAIGLNCQDKKSVLYECLIIKYLP
ncbi:MAG: hypothetical protein HS115_15635 [Spirochaetales bacterium]|nr:hypothetical protein [Spirochaetales bacterium]